MVLGEFTKQLAQQAIGNQVKEVMDSLRPPELSKIAENLTGEQPAAQGDNVDAIIVGQIQAMQKALKVDEELVVLCGAGLETLRVLEVYVPHRRVIVLIGIDVEKIVTRVIAPAETLQLVCRVMKVTAGAKPTRIRFVTPKP
jgi:hypothetical protein